MIRITTWPDAPSGFDKYLCDDLSDHFKCVPTDPSQADPNIVQVVIGVVIAYVVIGSLLGAMMELLTKEPNFNTRRFFAAAAAWPATLVVAACILPGIFIREVVPTLLGPNKHERTLAEIDRLEREMKE